MLYFVAIFSVFAYIGPVLQALNSELPGPDLWALGDLIDAFDFRGAEHATRALAQRLQLALDEPFDATRD